MQTGVYKMRKLFAIMLAFFTVFAIVGCSKKDDTPEGLDVGAENREYGYIFYVPEGWTVSNRADISAIFQEMYCKTVP